MSVLGVTGLLWAEYDGKKGLEQIIAEACKAHERRLGCKPNLVLANPRQVGKEVTVSGVVVRPASNVLPFHYHVYHVEEQPPEKAVPARA